MKIVNLKYLTTKKQYLVVLFFCCFQIVFCQKTFIVKDSITKEKLQFVQIKIDNNNYYTDSLGVFTINYNIKNNTVILQKSGYESNKINIENIRDEILLKPKEIQIQEIVINKKNKFVVGDRLYKKSTTFLTDNVELGILLEDNNNRTGFLNSIEFFIKKNKENENRYLEITFTEKDKNGNFSNQNILTLVKPIDNILKNKNVLDLKDYNIPFGKNGILVGLKIVNKVGSNNTSFEKSVLQFYNSKSKNNVYINNNNGWIRYPNETDVINIVLHVN